jgi:hypothetical protein
MYQDNFKSAKFKALLITEDGGETWLCVRQYYLTDLVSGNFMDLSMQGLRFKTIKEKQHDLGTLQGGGSGNSLL